MLLVIILIQITQLVFATIIPHVPSWLATHIKVSPENEKKVKRNHQLLYSGEYKLSETIELMKIESNSRYNISLILIIIHIKLWVQTLQSR